LIALVASSGILFLQGISLLWMTVFLFLMGIGASSQIITFALVHDINSANIAGTTNGLNNIFIMLGGVIMQPLVGFILNAVWDHKTFIDHVPAYSAHNFHQALLVLPTLSLVNIVVSAFCIKETL